MKPQELFDALERGEKIEYLNPLAKSWNPWSGAYWHEDYFYRIVKPAPKKVVRVREAVTEVGVVVLTQLGVDQIGRCFLGWVVGSEWKEVEYD